MVRAFRQTVTRRNSRQIQSNVNCDGHYPNLSFAQIY